jgi:CheY-like chemotaxis protein
MRGTGPINQVNARQITFLIVDDDADNRYLMGHDLAHEFQGCRVVESASMEEALAKLSEAQPDAVLTDHHLGLENGTAVIARIRAAGLDCPLIMITGSTNPSVHERARAAGANAVFLNWEKKYLHYLHGMLKS